VGRTVEGVDGLALVGRATVGPLAFPTPELIATDGTDRAAPGLRVRVSSSAPGIRGLTLTDGAAELPLAFPILAPEITAPPASGVAAGPRTVLVHAPLGAAPSRPAPGDAPELVVLGNARTLWADGRPFVAAIGQLRTVYGGAPAVWAPRVALPHRIPFLAYVGIDLVDETEALVAAGRGAFLDPSLGPLDPAIVRRAEACGCRACSTDPPGTLEDHARAACRRAITETRAAARAGRLRELVEARLIAEPALAEMLRYADRDLAPGLDERSPVVAVGIRSYALAESQRRPEMARFRRRLLERYRPPASKTVLLLVPCSKTKPYRRSRSHRRFAAALDGLPALERLHVVSVSSPIGLVPRELEDVPPARHYDIPVTGEWSEAEREAVLAGVRHLLAAGRYRSVIAHLDPHEYSFLAPALDGALPVRWTIAGEHTTSASALEGLRTAASAALAGEAPAPGGPLAVVREELAELASVQFGRATAERLLAPPLRLAGRPWFQRLTDGRTDLATVREERGLFHLTVAGARRLAPAFPLAVEVDRGLSLEGDLFVPGVRSADPAIREGDSVVLVRDGALAAVGEAALPGPLMRELSRGLAVRVRHRARGGTDTAMTEEAPRSDAGPVVQR
jgi:archaeosine synthase alpha-subunit